VKRTAILVTRLCIQGVLTENDAPGRGTASLDTYTKAPSSKARKSADDLQDVLMKRIANAQAGRDF
jgi:hypothetical protein